MRSRGWKKPFKKNSLPLSYGYFAFTHPSPVRLALVAESKDEDDGQNSEDNGEQDTHVIMWLEGKRGGTEIEMWVLFHRFQHV